MKGILLAGGSGTRLQPLTNVVSKQLLPVYSKPMIYYPLSTLMLAGIREIIIITTPGDLGQYQNLLGDGSSLGLELSYQVQIEPKGITHGVMLAEKFIAGDQVALILGDNIFHGAGVGEALRDYQHQKGATVFATRVRDPSRYGVIEIGEDSEPISIEEKPIHPKSTFAVTGLYFFDNTVFDRSKNVAPSGRGELEITDVHRSYLKSGTLEVRRLPRGTTWMDTGTIASLAEASDFIKGLESRHGVLVSCPEEIAWRNGWISDDALFRQAASPGDNEYKSYLLGLLTQERADRDARSTQFG